MGDTPKLMSESQRDLLSRLIDDKEIDDDVYRMVRQRLQNGTSSKAASGLITMLLAQPDKPGKGGVTKEGWFKHPKTGALYHVVRTRNNRLIALGCDPRTGKYTKWVRGVQFQMSDADCVDQAS